MVCRPGHENDVVEKIRHSAAHILADAVTRLFPTAKVTIGPVIENGFYYDFEFERPFTPEDLKSIEDKMGSIVSEKLPFLRQEISREEAISLFKNKGEKFKVEIIEGLPQGEPITLFGHGDFKDLCRGPHVDHTGQVKAFKLLSVAGSYWRGDEKRERLQRIYGTAFESKEELKDHLAKLEEAKKRDHRILGRDLELFGFHPEAPASPFFYPKGAFLYRRISDFLRGLYVDEGYDEVITPEILDVSLWEKSGHLEHFKDSMYFTSQEDREMAVKPMNCPGHCLMFAEKHWSYRELPVRFADFGRLHRYERSGVTHGLTRVRTFCQDDAHIFCTTEQMEDEILNFIALVQKVYAVFGFSEVHVALATKPESALGSAEMWERAEGALESALKKKGLSFQINHGEGAFYGPKIEFQVKDALGRPWQLGTLQVDYSMPDRFGLNYINTEGQQVRPVMLHRAILGSMERFLGIYLEHSAGTFPLWLAPTQTHLIPISEAQHEFAKEVAASLKKVGIRVHIDDRNEKLGLKIREAQLKKIPYMAVIGAKEAESRSVALRSRAKGDEGQMQTEEFVARLVSESPMPS